MIRFHMVVLGVLFGASLGLTTQVMFAQDKPKADDKPKVEATAPTLSDADKKVIVEAASARQMLVLQLENLQLKAQLTSLELEKASAAFQKLIAEKTPEGYQINDKLELVKKQ